MESHRVFEFDAFLSHRRGDGAHLLRAALDERGCRVWYDDDRPLTTRRLAHVVRDGFLRSRAILVHLSRDICSSAWPILEILSGLESEEPALRRVLFYVPDGVDVDGLPLPPIAMEALASRPRFDPTSIDALACAIKALNRLPPVPWGRPDATRAGGAEPARSASRLTQAISRYRDYAATQPPGRSLDGTVSTVEFHDLRIRSCQEILAEIDPAGRGESTDEAYRDFAVETNLQALKRPLPGEDVTPTPLVELRRAAVAPLARAAATGVRLRALDLLAGLAQQGDAISTRFLRLLLMAEADWEIIRRLPEPVWSNVRLLGLEHRLLAERGHVGRPWADELAAVSPEVRLALRPKEGMMRVGQLPPWYRVQVSLHWITTIATETISTTERRSSGDPNQDRELRLEDVELSFRELAPSLAELLVGDGPEDERTRCLEAVAAAIEHLTTVSESCGNLPLSRFASYYVDYLLPILGLLILNLDPFAMSALARRTFSILASCVPAWEIEAYEALVRECAFWRETGHSGTGPGAPINVQRSRFTIEGAEFRRRWLAGIAAASTR